MNDIERYIEEIALINRNIGAPDLTRPVAELLNDPDQTVYIAVFGQFKSGKSSMINSLLGTDILPTGVVPVTAIVTRIKPGTSPQLILNFNDGGERWLPVADLPSFVTEKHNPGNREDVDFATVLLPEMEPYRHLGFVDTPGLGSFYLHNSETTRQWLPSAGLALVSVSVERPLAQEDVELIQDLSLFCKDVVIILTKTDLFGVAELEEIKSYIADKIKEAAGRSLPVFEYSLFRNTEIFRARILNEIIKPLTENPEEKFEEIIGFKMLGIAERSNSYARLALGSALKREHAKESILQLLDDIERNRHFFVSELLLLSSSFKGSVREKLENIVMQYYQNGLADIRDKFDKEFSVNHGMLWQVTRRYEKWLKEVLGDFILSIDHEIDVEINRIVRESANYFEYSCLRFRERLDENLYRLFEVHLPGIKWQIDFAGISSPDISIYRTFDSHLDSLLFFLPMKWFGPVFKKHFRKQLPAEIQKNQYRYISDLTGKLIRAEFGLG